MPSATPPRILGSSYVWVAVGVTLLCIAVVVVSPIFESIYSSAAPRHLAVIRDELHRRGEE